MDLEIVMPFYGDPAQFREAVASVLTQRDPDWRLTVIDDAYPDTEPGEWFAALGDPRLRYLRNPENLGVRGAFQRSLDLSTGELITIMGCDDRMLPDYVGRARAGFARFPDGAYYQPGVRVIDDTGEPARPLADRVKEHYRIESDDVEVVGGERLARSLLRGNWTYFPSICWRADAVRAHGFSDYEVVLDLALQLDLVLDGGTMILDPETTFEYRRHLQSVSSWRADDGSRFIEEREVMHDYARRADAVGWTRAARAGRARVSSRLNALSRLPSAAASRSGGVGTLLAHAFGR